MRIVGSLLEPFGKPGGQPLDLLSGNLMRSLFLREPRSRIEFTLSSLAADSSTEVSGVTTDRSSSRHEGAGAFAGLAAGPFFAGAGGQRSLFDEETPQFEIRVNLVTGEFMESPPKGKERWLQAVVKEHLEEFRQAWDRYHPQRGGPWS